MELFLNNSTYHFVVKPPHLERDFEELKDIRPDALIISDPGVFAIAKRVLPDMELQVSTQANNTNYGTYLF